MRPFTLLLMRVRQHEDYTARGIKASDTLVFLGEISQIPEHGVWVCMRDGKLHVGLRIADFERVPEEDV